jgi:hypothetical protein
MRLLAGAVVLAWLAIMAFFAGIVAPAAFSALDREAAGRLVAAVFPRYYLIGAVLGGLAVVSLGAPALLGRGRPGDGLGLVLLLGMLGATLYAWLVVLPAAHAAREAARAAGAVLGTASPEAMAFARLHRLSTALNGVTMLAGVLFLVLSGLRR